MDPTTELIAGPELELVAVVDGARRDVIVRRQGVHDFLIYDGNIAGIELEEDPQEKRETTPPPAEEVHRCETCSREFTSSRALKAHIQRAHAAAAE